MKYRKIDQEKIQKNTFTKEDLEKINQLRKKINQVIEHEQNAKKAAILLDKMIKGTSKIK